jgi:hypothetical protein
MSQSSSSSPTPTGSRGLARIAVLALAALGVAAVLHPRTAEPNEALASAAVPPTGGKIEVQVVPAPGFEVDWSRLPDEPDPSPRSVAAYEH